ncbi:hypothetical protein H5410_009638 [Solanum commersonii]|uniref:Uncharacterized protein n=1 Tax=Solanum commersonii TaxID=4109 RepID=A0A9J6AJB0_SOLCO|nr:hypothetical protein H5410_009638 [Solanum commersonii]
MYMAGYSAYHRSLAHLNHQITQQLTHRSRDIWHGNVNMILNTRRCDGKFWDLVKKYLIHPRVPYTTSQILRNPSLSSLENVFGESNELDDSNDEVEKANECGEPSVKEKRTIFPKRCGTRSHYLRQHGKKKQAKRNKELSLRDNDLLARLVQSYLDEVNDINFWRWISILEILLESYVSRHLLDHEVLKEKEVKNHDPKETYAKNLAVN